MSTLRVPELAAFEVPGTTRGAFLARAALAAGAVSGVGAVGPFVRRAIAQADISDVDIMNFALALEHLEAIFYSRAMATVPDFSPEVKALTVKLAGDEAKHVKFLGAAIRQHGGKPIKRPTVQYGPGTFDSQTTYLKLANVFEDTGVSAYNGAAPMIRSKEVLAAAGSIVQIEARHAALIRLARGKPTAPLPFDKPSDIADVAARTRTFFTGTPPAPIVRTATTGAG